MIYNLADIIKYNLDKGLSFSRVPETNLHLQYLDFLDRKLLSG